MTAQGKFVKNTDKGMQLTPKGRALGIFSLLLVFGLCWACSTCPWQHRPPTLLTCCTLTRRCHMTRSRPYGSKQPRPTFPSARSRCSSPAVALPSEVRVRALEDGQNFAIMVSWDDDTKNDTVGPVPSDAGAIQLPIDPQHLPYQCMGQSNSRVNIWQWKAALEKAGRATMKVQRHGRGRRAQPDKQRHMQSSRNPRHRPERAVLPRWQAVACGLLARTLSKATSTLRRSSANSIRPLRLQSGTELTAKPRNEICFDLEHACIPDPTGNPAGGLIDAGRGNPRWSRHSRLGNATVWKVIRRYDASPSRDIINYQFELTGGRHELTSREIEITRPGLLSAEGSASRNFLYSAIFWLTIADFMGLIAAMEMISPDFLAGIPYLTFGRLRPMHVNGVLFMWLSMAQIGAFFYIVPKLCGVKLHSEVLGNITMILWNMVGVVGYITLSPA